MAIQGFFTGDVKIKDLNGVLKAVDGIVEVATDAGTVTSVGLTVGSTGTDVNVANSPVTTSGSITLNIPTSSATNRGLLSSADWSTFNSKQGTITLTTTGSSGAATLIGTTLNIPNYSGALSGYVPYTGATANVDLGEYELKAGQLTLDVSPTGTAAVGTTRWNNTIGSSETTLKGGNVILKNGVDLVARVVNKVTPNTTLTKANYPAVRVSGAAGQRLAVAYAQANNDNNSADTIGLVTETIATNQEGFIMTVGQLLDINTTGSLQGETWADGDVLYLSPTTPGALTNVKPNGSTGHIVVMGYVEYAHANHGSIYVKVMNGWELDELHNVYISSVANNQGLFYESSTQLWKNKSIATVLGYTPANAATTITINGTTYDISTNRTWSVGTVTSIGTSGPITGGTITGSGTIGITQATTSTDGYLSSTDWNTFNSKQAALTFSAPLINTSGTISIPAASASVNGYLSSTDWATFNNKQAALSGTGFVKISGTTISYDNSTYYLASNPSSFITLTALSATAPLSYSNTTGVFSISQATTSTNGYLSSTDWNTFNNKQAAGNYITALTGEATASGPGSASVTLSTSAVTGKLLTGLNLTGGGTIAATDSILQAFGKVQNQISGLAGGVTYQGTWNASTNTPTLTSSVGTKGYYYIVDVAGSTNLNGITDWKIGDWAIFNGSTWDKVDNTDAVSSVNGFTGAVSLTTSNIAEGTNLYYLDSRARLALSFTAGSGTYDNTTGVITIPTNTSQLTNGANFITLSSLSASSPLAYNSGTGAFSIQVATGSQNGYLSSTDWTTFNSKQAAGNYVTTDTTQTITALKTFTAKVVINTGGTDDQLQLVGTAPSIRLNNAATGATINGFIAMSGGDNNYIQGSVSGDMTIGNQNNGKILFGFGSGTATRKMSLDSSGNAVLSGGLTLGSTLSNGTYTYTLPGATGTLALVGGAGVGTVTSVAALTIGTSGTDLSSTVANSTTTPVITLNVPTASATNRGALSSTDWTTFNNKQNALTNPVTGTGTTNYLPKFTGASTIGNSAIFDDSGKIGIGTATPDASFKLTISGNSAAVSPGIYFLDEASSPTNYALYTNGSKNFVLRNQSTSNNIAVFTPSGNLGLGVTPSAWASGIKAIDVNAYASFFGDNDTTFISNNGFLNSSFSWIYKANNLATYYRQQSGQHIWYNAPSGTAGNAISFTQAMTLNASGNLSIGNTNDTYKLDVTGTGRYYSNSSSAGNATGVRIEQAGTGDAAISYLLSGVREWLVGIDNSDGDAFKINNITGSSDFNNVGFSLATTGAATFSSSVTATGGLISNGGSIGYGGGELGFGVTTSGATSGIYTVATGSPILYFDHRGTSNTGFWVWRSGTGGGTTALTLSNAGAATFSSSVRATGLLIGDDRLYMPGNQPISNWFSSSLSAGYSSSNSYAWVNGATNLVLGTDGNERMRITSGGLVGIGVTPSAWNTTTFPIVLQVGNASLHTNGGTFSQLMNNAFFDGSTYRYIGTGGIGRMGFDTDGAIFWGNAASGSAGASVSFTERMRITSGGNVGIGTTSPKSYASLTTNGSIVAIGGIGVGVGESFRLNNYYNAGTGTDRTIATGYAASVGLDNSGGGMTFNLSSSSITADNNVTVTERMRITSGGNVGIGTTSPGARLSISANAGADVLEVAGYDVLKWDSGDILTFGGYKSSEWNAVAFATAGSERMRITSGGALCIGRTTAYSAGYLLNVEGNIYASAQLECGTSIQTGAPTNGTARQWKLGNAVSGTISTNYYIIVEINGTTYSIPALQGLP